MSDDGDDTTAAHHQQSSAGAAAEKHAAEAEEEIPWTDDRIRWPDDDDNAIIHTTNEDNTTTARSSNNDDDEGYYGDTCYTTSLFKPDPHDTFSFQFPYLHSNNNNNNKVTTRDDDETTTTTTTTTDSSSSSIIRIEIRGFKAESDEIYQSTGLTLWRASRYLCRYMLEHADELLFPHQGQQKKRILELGAGLGLNGILAHHLAGATGSTVCLTDGDTEALVHLRENVQRNCTCTTTDSSAGMVSCHQLIWGRESATTFLEQQGQTFDVVLASDILYAECIIEPLWETVQTLLSRADDAVFVLAFARRKVPVTIEFVLSSANQAGFSHECAVHDDEEGIFIYEFRWKTK